MYICIVLAYLVWVLQAGQEALKTSLRDFPGGPVVKNPPYSAGDAGSIPGQGTKIPHAAGQLSPHATTTELEHLDDSPRAANYRAHVPWSLRATTREKKPTHHN